MLTVFAARDTNVHLTHETVFADDDDKSGRTLRNTRVLPDIPDNVLTIKTFLATRRFTHDMRDHVVLLSREGNKRRKKKK